MLLVEEIVHHSHISVFSRLDWIGIHGILSLHPSAQNSVSWVTGLLLMYSGLLKESIPRRAFQREKVLLITVPQWPHYNREMIIPPKEDWILCACVYFQMRIKWECILTQSESRKIEVRVGEILIPGFLPSFNFCLFIFASNCPVPSTAIFTYKMLYKHDIINHTDMLCCRIPLENRQYELQRAGN